MKIILVADDMAIFREPIEAVLCGAGFKVVTATNGVEVLKAVAATPPDLILLDLAMPVLDGLATLGTLRGQDATRHLPVIVLSAETDKSRIIEAVKLGISGYLLKSQFSLKAMLERVQLTLAPDATPRSQDAQVPASQASATPVASESAASPPPQTSSAPSAPLAGAGARPTGRPGASADDGRASAKIAGLQPASDLKALQPLLTRSALFERVAADQEITGFSPTVAQVLKISSSDRCSMDQVAKAVGQDQAIALKILKLSNSSAFSIGDRVDSVQKAVLRIGMDSIRQAVLNIAVVERFASLSFDGHLSTPLFWEHSIACGLTAAALARSLGHKDPDIAFTAGLLHDLGRVIYAERLGEEYVRVLETARAARAPLELVEGRMLLVTHAEIMSRILQAWRFPKELATPIVHHHCEAGEIRKQAPHQVGDVLRLGLADRLVHALALGSSGNDTIYPTEAHCRMLKVTPAAIAEFERTARQSTDDTKFALLTHSNAATWPRSLDQYRAMLKQPFRPLYVSAAPEFDAFRMFCGELAGPPGDGPPNIAVVHVAAAAERAGLSERMAAAEQEARAQNLPMIVFSPTGTWALSDELMGSRRRSLMRTPTPIVQIVKCINAMLAPASERAAA